ncbi:MAG: FAD-binding oxidoreductase, partial [Bdellovibrionaceae bacterium]|nr:FAD-binding oxidoreductase [Pseudobdellovibrionaceae bacterium]
KTDKGTFETPNVMLTLNAYLPMVLKEYAKLILPQRGQILVTEPLPKFVRGPCYLTKFLCYFRQLPTGNILIGGFRNHSLATENTAQDQTTEIIQTELLKFVRETFTQGAAAKVAYQWSGIMGFTPDDHMMIGKAHGQNTGRDGVYLMAGCGGHGMGLSFHAAKVLVGSVFGKPVPDYLDIQRFQI